MADSPGSPPPLPLTDLRLLDPADFLPGVAGWIQWAGVLLVGSFCGGLALLAVTPAPQIVRASGQLRPAGETSVVQAPSDGRITEILVGADQAVRRGQVLARLDPADLVAQRQALGEQEQGLAQQIGAQDRENQASLNGLTLDGQKAASALELAHSEWQRYALLYRSGAGSAEQLEAKAANYRAAELGLARTEQELSEQQARNQSRLTQLEQQRRQVIADAAQLGRDLGRTEILAPVDGVLLSLQLRNPQQWVSAGQELARIAPSGRALVARVQVSSDAIARLAVGQSARLKVDGCPYPDYGTMPARLIQVAPDVVSTAGEKGHHFALTLRPARLALGRGGNQCRLRPGMELRAEITTSQDTVLKTLLRRLRLGADV